MVLLTLKQEEPAKPATTAVTQKQDSITEKHEPVPSNIGEMRNENGQNGLMGSAEKAPPTCSASGEVAHTVRSKACLQYDSSTPQECAMEQEERPFSPAASEERVRRREEGRSPRGPYKCSMCGEVGHNRRTCRPHHLTTPQGRDTQPASDAATTEQDPEVEKGLWKQGSGGRMEGRSPGGAPQPRKCSACREEGHNKRSKECRLYSLQ